MQRRRCWCEHGPRMVISCNTSGGWPRHFLGLTPRRTRIRHTVDVNATVLHDLENGEVVRDWRIGMLAFSPTEDRLVGAHRRKLEVLDLRTLETERSIPLRGARRRFERFGRGTPE